MPTRPPIHRRHQGPALPARPAELIEFYGSRRWRLVSEQIRHEHPLCADPFGTHAKENRVVPSQEVHHRIPLRQGLAYALDASNLMAVCRACHEALERDVGHVHDVTKNVNEGGGAGGMRNF